MRVILVLLSIVIFLYDCVAQNQSKVKDEVRLVKWSTQECDNTFDPYRLKTRVSSIEYTDTTTNFTIHFSENCCAKFTPQIKFTNNKLVLLPFEEYTGDYCTCNCCFSIKYEVAGLAGKKYKLYFRDKEVFLSENYYDTVKPSYKNYNGRKINASNKYGFKEGIWISFYKNGKEKSVSKYPDKSLFFEPEPIWSKSYYSSGRLEYFSRNDTSESWFEDGEVKSQFIEYKVGDTVYEKGLRKFENRMLQMEYLERYYPTVFKSEFDAEYEGEGGIFETVHKREYFKNGKPKYIHGTDTSFSWFESGQLESKRFKWGQIKFDKGGWISEREFSWVEKGSKFVGDLRRSLYVTFYANGNIKEFHFVRDELSDDGEGVSNSHFHWKWDMKQNLIEAPEEWNEAYPWQRFAEIQLPPAMYKGLKK